jgi:hypothetical protein
VNGQADDAARRPMLVYLSGNVRKGDADLRPPEAFWSPEDEARLVAGVTSTPLVLLNPARSRVDRADYRANFGCDLHLVRTSDAILVDARSERGIGVGGEMMFARYAGTPVITVCPPNTFYRRDVIPGVDGRDLRDWVHPFVAGLSDEVVSDLDAAVTALDRLARNGFPRRNAPGLEEAIAYYHRGIATLDARPTHVG